MRKTKIVATIGPASESEEKLSEMAEAGLNVARINFSHASHSGAKKKLETVRNVSESIAVMMDTKGPEIRLREVEEGTTLKKGEKVEITTDEGVGDEKNLTVDYGDFARSVSTGDRIIVGDGLSELKVRSINNDTVTCRVLSTGKISSKKSLTVPEKDLGLSAPTDKDIEDIEFGAKQDFDFVSLSFVKKPEDVRKARKIIEEKNSDMKIISKIEHKEAIENFEEILKVSDGIMVARGDLGIQVSASDVPMLQKDVIRKCNESGKPVITATHMLKSMTDSPTATRAEVSDVANSVLDGTDAVMLSEETAVGEYPVKTIEFMADTVQKIEKHIDRDLGPRKRSKQTIPDIICKSVYDASEISEIKYIIAPTMSGYTARMIAKHRPKTDIIAFTPSPRVRRELSVIWGVEARLYKEAEHLREILTHSVNNLYEEGRLNEEDKIILTAGAPAKDRSRTNMMEIRKAGDVLER